MDGIQLNRGRRIEARQTLETRMDFRRRFTLGTLLELVHLLNGLTRVMVSRVKLFDSESIKFTNRLLTELIMGQSRPWSDRYLFSPFNGFQQLSTRALPAALKRVELLSAVTFRTSLEGRSTRSVGREFLVLKRIVRVHAFTCPR
jgi:hypothetical protein